MHYVEIKNACSCAIKRALPEKQEFEDKEKAEAEANRLLAKMHLEFCKKHTFELKNEFGNFNIYVRVKF
ncbi:hypothetical protein JHD50_07305 [Sulfurimonas sp. MAG313]|nr:hypothetical protein [Sulfurimonas sp. MAG313]MDF1881111.1 hypothetical protein [Sulfurimonas sp. MAG313]